MDNKKEDDEILRVREIKATVRQRSLYVYQIRREISVCKQGWKTHLTTVFVCSLLKSTLCVERRKQNSWRISEDLKCKDKRACKWRINFKRLDLRWWSLNIWSVAYKFLNKYLWNEQNIICCYHLMFDTRVCDIMQASKILIKPNRDNF